MALPIWLRSIESQCPAAFRVLMEHKRAVQEGAPLFPTIPLSEYEMSDLKKWVALHGPRTKWHRYANQSLPELELWLVGQDRDLLEARKLKLLGLAFQILFRVIDQNDQTACRPAIAAKEVARKRSEKKTAVVGSAKKTGRPPEKGITGKSPNEEDAIYTEWLERDKGVSMTKFAGLKNMKLAKMRLLIRRACDRARK